MTKTYRFSIGKQNCQFQSQCDQPYARLAEQLLQEEYAQWKASYPTLSESECLLLLAINAKISALNSKAQLYDMKATQALNSEEQALKQSLKQARQNKEEAEVIRMQKRMNQVAKKKIRGFK